jgi:tRNA(adenine34) deaminase
MAPTEKSKEPLFSVSRLGIEVSVDSMKKNCLNCFRGMASKRTADEYFMEMALAESILAYKDGEVPVGAVLVKDNKVIARAHNQRETLKDPTGHAEIIALKDGSKEEDSWRLTDLTLYVTKEPCIMCAGAMVNARLGRLVYGCKDEKGGAVDSLYSLLSDKRLNHQVRVEAGVLEEECSEILKKFFRNRR